MPATAAPTAKRLRIAIRGAVQGVGFRPFIFRLATELGLSGWVNNSAQGVVIEVEGAPGELEQFLVRLEPEKPPRSFIQSSEATWLDPAGCAEFEIRHSQSEGPKTALVLPDIATCPDCLREIFDPDNRRFEYPFTNCTHCGPRFSIVESLPYDRAGTSMRQFAMCPRCQAEYDDPRDRRFHAQPNACPECGPKLEIRDARGNALAADPLAGAADAIRAGAIVAVKGLGGFHLMVAAHDERAVQRLRRLKHREEKPFAVMFPSLNSAKATCEISPIEERLLRSPEAPIVLLRRAESSEVATRGARGPKHAAPIADAVVPRNPNLGVMLPYTPLHHLLMTRLGFPVVATSGNLSDEPICIDERDAVERLGGIADLFLVHNRPIVRHVDDSIVRVMLGREMVLRRARGYAPLPITRNPKPKTQNPKPILAVGAHLKNTVALSAGSNVFLSQHIGDLETDQAFAAFQRVAEDLQKLYDAPAATVASDLHPEYLSTQWADERAARRGWRRVSVQHHIAHVLSCMAENELAPPVLGVSWDGTGLGLDGTIWGGEFFVITDAACERVAHFRPFRLPGGDAAIREPRRSALGVLFELFGASAFEMRHLPPLRNVWNNELATLRSMLQRGVNSPLTSSAGRLFDAVAALAGLRQRTRFEGQAAMELEFATGDSETGQAYEIELAPQAGDGNVLVLDWEPAIRELLRDLDAGVSVCDISAKFHNGLTAAIAAVTGHFGIERVALSGGCFQNRYLTERTVRRLEADEFRPYWHQRVPPNDGGIALGQIAAALRQKE